MYIHLSSRLSNPNLANNWWYHLLATGQFQAKFEGSLMILHEAEDDAVNWLNSVATTALKK